MIAIISLICLSILFILMLTGLLSCFKPDKEYEEYLKLKEK